MAECFMKKFVFLARISVKGVFGVAIHKHKPKKLNFKMAEWLIKKFVFSPRTSSYVVLS